MDGFINGRVLRRLEKKELIESEPQQVPRIVIEMAGTKHCDPEIEQRQVAEDSIEKLCGEGAIRRVEIAGPQKACEDGVGKLFTRAPFS